MTKGYLAIDIGAGSGRAILASVEDGRLIQKEIHRFENGVQEQDGRLVWDAERLFENILIALERCGAAGNIPRSMAIDTWGCDYLLLDENEQPIGPLIAYRDPQHEHSQAALHTAIEARTLFARNGLQRQPFNTLYQLYGDKRREKAQSFLMVPDYLAWRLCGKKTNEYTNLSTSGLLDVKNKKLAEELLFAAGIDPSLFEEFVMPGQEIGSLRPEIQERVGFSCRVIACASHDTGSAYLAAARKDQLILSSGTWSLLGTICRQPVLDEGAYEKNWTNEGCADDRIRFLKNIMGLWIIQEVARDLDNRYSFARLVELAQADPFRETFDVDQARYLKPDNMSAEICRDYEERGLQPPETPGQLADAVYRSLAQSTARAIAELEAITGKHYDILNIIGGGCQNRYLSDLIGAASGKNILSGPVEATALGNIAAQLKRDGIDYEQFDQLLAASGLYA